MLKQINRKELFLIIYDNIRYNKEKYYVPIINSGTNPTLQDVFEGSDRLFFVENGLYFISEKVLDAYKSIFPKNLNFISIDENEFNLILENICLNQLPTKPIALVEDEKNYIVEKSSILVNWLNENIKDRKKENIDIKYIDSDNSTLTKSFKKKKSNFKEKIIIDLIIATLILLKVLFLYVSYLFSFKILMLSGFIAIFILITIFVFLNTLCDFIVKEIIHSIT